MPEWPPSVDRLLSSQAFAPLIEDCGRMVVRDALREVQARYRQLRLGQEAHPGELDYAQQVEELLKQGSLGHGGPVFNMTGVLLHSNLGRATLDVEISSRVAREASGHVLLELDARTGKRGDRETSVQESLKALTGAEAAAVVNNNAAAVMLMLATLCTRARSEVIVSRGELVEIGGSFRLPEIMRSAGAKTGRGRHHQRDAPRRLHRRNEREDGRHPQGAHQQLLHTWVYRHGDHSRTRRNHPDRGHSTVRGSWQRVPRQT